MTKELGQTNWKGNVNRDVSSNVASLHGDEDIALAGQLEESYRRVREELGKIVLGQADVVDLVMLTLLVGGGYGAGQCVSGRVCQADVCDRAPDNCTQYKCRDYLVSCHFPFLLRPCGPPNVSCLTVIPSNAEKVGAYLPLALCA